MIHIIAYRIGSISKPDHFHYYILYILFYTQIQKLYIQNHRKLTVHSKSSETLTRFRLVVSLSSSLSANKHRLTVAPHDVCCVWGGFFSETRSINSGSSISIGVFSGKTRSINSGLLISLGLFSGETKLINSGEATSERVRSMSSGWVFSVMSSVGKKPSSNLRWCSICRAMLNGLWVWEYWYYTEILVEH